MPTEIGEAREKWGKDVWELVENFANAMSKEVKPFYIVYACKPDPTYNAAFRQTIKAYYRRPVPLIGILVWYVNHPLGEFRFIPELSAPPDVPLDPRLLSDKASDASASISVQGEKLNVLVS